MHQVEPTGLDMAKRESAEKQNNPTLEGFRGKKSNCNNKIS
jgi:hypothetical protein